MRIEDITGQSMKRMKDDSALKMLRLRMLDIYNRYFKDSDMEKAEKTYNSGIKVAPQLWGTYYNLARFI